MTSLRERYTLLYPLFVVPAIYLAFSIWIDPSFISKILASFLVTIPLAVYVITTKIEPTAFIYGLFNLMYLIAAFLLLKNNIKNKLLVSVLYIYSIIQGFALLLVVLGRWC